MLQSSSYSHSCSWPLGFTLDLQMNSFPSFHLLTYRSFRYHSVCLTESYAFHLQRMFLYCANYKRLTFPFSFPFASLIPPSSLSAASEEKRNVDSIKEQGSHLLLWFTALLGWVRSEGGAGGETERLVISAVVRAKKPRQYDSRQCRLSLQADPPCCHMQGRATAAHITQRGRERESGINKVEWVSEREDIRLMGLMGGRNKQKLLTAITNIATERFDHTWALANRVQDTDARIRTNQERHRTGLC